MSPTARSVKLARAASAATNHGVPVDGEGADLVAVEVEQAQTIGHRTTTPPPKARQARPEQE